MTAQEKQQLEQIRVRLTDALGIQFYTCENIFDAKDSWLEIDKDDSAYYLPFSFIVSGNRFLACGDFRYPTGFSCGLGDEVEFVKMLIKYYGH